MSPVHASLPPIGRPGRLACLAGTLALVAACGGGGDSSNQPPPPPPPPAVNQAPVAAFTAPATVQADAPAVLDASASSDPEGGPLTFAWDFGDGTLGGAAQIAHLYAAAGNYTARLTVTDAQGAATRLTRAITVTAAPAAARTVQVAGLITGVDGAPLPGVSVSVQGAVPSTSSGADGRLSLAVGVGVDVVLRLAKPGYADQVKRLTLPSGVGADASFDAVLVPRGATQTLADAAAGGTVSGVDGARLEVPAGALVDAETGAGAGGAVQVSLTPVDVNAGALPAFPGRFEGVNADGTRTPIVSYGTVEFTLQQGGRALQLKPGARATVELPLYASLDLDRSTLAAGGKLPLWSLDERSGQWINEGQGTLVASAASPTGLALRATVGHLSWWNIDKGYVPYRPKPRCINDVPGQYDSIFEQATVCKMLAEMDKGVPASTGRERPSSLPAAAAADAAPPRFPFPAVRVDATVPIAGGQSIDVPPLFDLLLSGAALNGTWRGQVRVQGGEGATGDVNVPLRPVAIGGSSEAITLPFDEVRSAAPGRIDRYRFTAAAGQGLQIGAAQALSTLTGTLRLRDAAGVLRATSPFALNGATATFTVVTAGEYTIEVEPLANAPGAYRLQAAFSQVLNTPLADNDDAPGRGLVAVNPTGDAVLAWTRSTSQGVSVMVRRFTIGANSWTDPLALATVSGLSGTAQAGDLQVGIDGGGNATVLWEQGGAGPAAARFDAGTQTWGVPLTLGSAACPGGIDVPKRMVVDAQGDVSVAWVRGLNAAAPGVCTRRYAAAAGAWLAERTIDSPVAPGGTELALGATPSGQVLLLWLARNGTEVTSARYYPANNTWGSPVAVFNDGTRARELTLGLAPQGSALAAWTTSDRVSASVLLATANAWEAVPISARAAKLRALALGGSRFHLVWEAPLFLGGGILGAGFDLQTRLWGDSLPVVANDASAPQLLDVAADGSGRAVALWVAYPTGPTVRGQVGVSMLSADGTAWAAAADKLSSDYFGGASTLPSAVAVAGGQSLFTVLQYRRESDGFQRRQIVVGRLAGLP